MTQMTDVYHFTLLPATDEDAFVAFARQEGFPRASVTRAGTVTRQQLLKEHAGEDGARRYLWVVHWTLHFGLDALEQIAGSLWNVHPRMQSQAELISFARYIQAAESTSPTDDAGEA